MVSKEEQQAISKLQAKAERTQAACLADAPKSARELFAGFLKRYDAGEISPYKKRLEEKSRIQYQKELIQSRGHRYAACSFENFETQTAKQTNAIKQLRDYAKNMPDRLAETNGGGVMFTGPPGTGKDHLLMALMTSAILDHGFTARWTDGIRLFQKIKGAIAKNQTGAEIAKHTKPQILAISDPVPPRDDLSTYELACIREIIDTRYSNGLSTWTTTNIRKVEEAREKLTAAVLGRLLDRSLEIKCEWPGYRRSITSSI